jgi:hypothetical protein
MEHQTMNAYGNKFRYSQVGGKDFDWLMHMNLVMNGGVIK